MNFCLYLLNTAQSLLKCTETRNWTEEILCKEWSEIIDDVA
jgi:hypothetical protein